MEFHDYTETRATGKLGRHTVFELVCRHVAKVARLGDEEREALKKLQKFLRLPPEEAREILERAKEDEATSSRRDELSGEEVFEQACELAWSDGPLELRELKLLKGLAAVMHLDAATGQRILDETYEGSLAAMKDAADAARDEEPGEDESGSVSVSLTDAGPPESAAVQQESVQPEPRPERPAAWGRPPATSSKERGGRADASSKPERSPSLSASEGFAVLPELVRGLFTAPKETLAWSMQPECRVATLSVLGAYFGLAVLTSPYRSKGLDLAVLHSLAYFLIGYLGLLWGGQMTGGRGEAMPILQMWGLVLPVVFLMRVASRVLGVPFLAFPFEFVLSFFLMKIGHGLSDLKSVGLAYGVGAAVALLVGGPLLMTVMKIAAGREDPGAFYY